MSEPTPPDLLYLWPGRFLLLGSALRNRPHWHLAASLLIGLEQDFELRVDERRRHRSRAALVAPNVRQGLDSRGGRMLILHVDPDLPEFRRLAPRLAGQACCLLDALLPQVLAAVSSPWSPPRDADEAAACFERLLTAVAGELTPAPPPDPRIARIAARLRAEPPERVELAALALDHGLSDSRLMHLFKAELGVPLRRFVLGLRLQQAMQLWQADMTGADVAAAAGFYDQPHLVRTAREMMDFLPSRYADRHSLQVTRCA